MKLHNKKDGTITEGAVWIETKVHREPWHCESIEELNAHWEDYKPKEPLIKDEKIRKAVRAWAEVCGVGDSEKLRVCQGHGCSFICVVASDAQFSLIGVDYGIPYDDYCTIAELCGEEEE